ncbi:hypothetical protein [Ferrovum sp. PN-J185]|uniref:hypothetical protein n=1 Tax=Ferrovum sp. PN-J185 TaxID=1356306 RepID=UPI000798C0C7|nr:hypothetical protein [Ferrovum sp. PN-J185]KXW55378.1 hypothetical protein FV185_16250 [Ferrovum sp. PN-J185]
MANRQKLPRFKDQGSSWESAGLYAAIDWRYDALVDYLKLSPSYKLVSEWTKRGQKTLPTNSPRDWSKLTKTYEDFGDVWRIPESRWWDSRGRELFGIKAAKTQSFTVGKSDDKNLMSGNIISNSQKLWEDMAQPECLIVAIPTNQTKQMVLRQINAIIRSNTFITSKPKLVKPKYELVRSKLREPTIKLGTIALKMYQVGKPLWAIGNELGLSPAHAIQIDKNGKPISNELNLPEKKMRLQVLASKLIAKAELIAENAARGRFPTDAPCTFAIKFESKTRKVGRPSKVK